MRMPIVIIWKRKMCGASAGYKYRILCGCEWECFTSHIKLSFAVLWRFTRNSGFCQRSTVCLHSGGAR